jgi:hypothetical protein
MKSLQSLLSPLLLGSLLAATAAAQTPQQAPTITFQPRSITVAGITPKGQALGFSVARELAEDDVATVVRRTQVLTDDDGDGKVEWDLDRDVPLRSIWVAVDLATGQVAAASPAGYPLRRVSWRGGGLGRGGAGADQVADIRSFVEVLLVRPGQGAWQLTVADGSAQDADGAADGKLAAALDRLEPVPGLPGIPGPPSRFDPSDVVVVLDPNRMELIVVQAGKPQAGQTGQTEVTP